MIGVDCCAHFGDLSIASLESGRVSVSAPEMRVGMLCSVRGVSIHREWKLWLA
jgi:hypothetical protein